MILCHAVWVGSVREMSHFDRADYTLMFCAITIGTCCTLYSQVALCISVHLSHYHILTCISNVISPTSWDSDLNWVMMLIILHSFYCFFWLMSICLWAVNIIKTTRTLLLCWVMFNSSEKIGGSVSLYTAACMSSCATGLQLTSCLGEMTYPKEADFIMLTFIYPAASAHVLLWEDWLMLNHILC